MQLNEGQRSEILQSYRWMYQALSKLAGRRNTMVLPQLNFEARSVEDVGACLLLTKSPESHPSLCPLIETRPGNKVIFATSSGEEGYPLLGVLNGGFIIIKALLSADKGSS